MERPSWIGERGSTTHQLLTHTAGLVERFAGAYTDSTQHLQPLSDHLRRYTPEQAIRPGSAESYANYGYAHTGLLVERLSGLAYEDYMAERVFRPLRMTATTARQPPQANLTNDLVRGYRWVDGRHEPLAYGFTQAAPSGGMSATAADMGRFMLALLQEGSVDGERVLSPESVKMMLAPQQGRGARVCAIFVAVANLTFVVGFAVFSADPRGLGGITPLRLPVVLWLSLPVASVAVTAVLPAFAAWAWREGWWTRGERLGFSTFVALSLVFMMFVNYWKLLGIRY